MFSLPYLLFRLAAIAAEMREAQKMYFVCRTAGNLALAKRLEGRLDKCLRLIQDHPDYLTHTFTHQPTQDEAWTTDHAAAQTPETA